MPLLLVALVLAAAAVPGRALDLDPRHDGIDTADLSVTVTNKSRRRVEQIALREPDGIERDSDAFGYDGLAPGRQRTFTVAGGAGVCRSEEHTSELQSLMRISYAVFCLTKKKSSQ